MPNLFNILRLCKSSNEGGVGFQTSNDTYDEEENSFPKDNPSRKKEKMVFEMKEIQENEMVEIIKVAHESIKLQCQFQLDLAAEIPGTSPKRVYSHEDHNDDVRDKVMNFCYKKCKSVKKRH